MFKINTYLSFLLGTIVKNKVELTAMKNNFLIFLFSFSLLSACQTTHPALVDYNGVDVEIATWIKHQKLSTQQKTSLVQLSKAQQKLIDIENIQDNQKFTIAKENAIAMHCAHQRLTENKNNQLQDQIFGQSKFQILEIYKQQFPKLKIDVNSIQCE